MFRCLVAHAYTRAEFEAVPLHMCILILKVLYLCYCDCNKNLSLYVPKLIESKFFNNNICRTLQHITM